MKQRKIYRILGIVSAIEFLRPGAKYALMDNKLEWFDSRPAPSAKEINETLQKIKDFEDSIEGTIWTDEQLQQFDEAGIVDHLPPIEHYLRFKDYFLYLQKKKKEEESKLNS